MYSVTDLETFVTVARQGGITAAARVLRISAATTSHRITKLETVLGVKLFHRDSRTFSLSDEGLVYLERIEPLMADLRQAEIDAGGGTSALKGHLRATMSPWILSRFILPHLEDFRRDHPDLTIEFLTVDRYVPLVEEGQDCAVRVGNLTDSALIARKLSDNDRIICAAPRLLEKTGKPEEPADLKQALWVCLPWQMQFDVKVAGGTRRRIAMTRNVTVSNSDILTEAAIQGLGFAIKSRLAVAEELADGRLVEVLPGVLDPSEAPIWFVCPPHGRHNRKTMEFGKLVSRAFQTPSPTA